MKPVAVTFKPIQSVLFFVVLIAFPDIGLGFAFV
jgi:hypothetical protein